MARRRVAAAILAGGALLALPAGGIAQDGRGDGGDTGGGVVLSFGLSARLETGDNLDLATPSEGRATRLTTRLDMGLVSETRTQRLAFSLGGTLKGGDVADTAKSLAPEMRLSYRREAAAAVLDLSAFFREAEIADLRFEDPGGELDDLDGTGTRRSTGGDVGLTLGGGGPWELALSAGITDTDYIDTSDPDLVDNTRTRARAGLRFALAPDTEASLALRYAGYDEPGAPRRDTLGLEAGLSRAQPAGSWTLTAFADDTEDGLRAGLALGRSLETPRGRLAADIGVTWPAQGEATLTGGLDWSEALPQGSLTASLRRSVADGTGDAEQIRTLAAIDWSREITPAGGLSLGASWTATEDTGSGETSETGSLTAAWRQQLAQDWTLDAGVTHRRRDDSDGQATANLVFLGIGRRFEWRP